MDDLSRRTPRSYGSYSIYNPNKERLLNELERHSLDSQLKSLYPFHFVSILDAKFSYETTDKSRVRTLIWISIGTYAWSPVLDRNRIWQHRDSANVCQFSRLESAQSKKKHSWDRPDDCELGRSICGKWIPWIAKAYIWKWARFPDKSFWLPQKNSKR